MRVLDVDKNIVRWPGELELLAPLNTVEATHGEGELLAFVIYRASKVGTDDRLRARGEELRLRREASGFTSTKALAEAAGVNQLWLACREEGLIIPFYPEEVEALDRLEVTLAARVAAT